jgi:hypothetical protein
MVLKYRFELQFIKELDYKTSRTKCKGPLTFHLLHPDSTETAENVVTSFAHDVPLIETIPAVHDGLEEVQGRSLAYKYRAQQMNRKEKRRGDRERIRQKKITRKPRNREKAEERHRDEDQPHHRLCPFISELKVIEYKNQEHRRRKLNPTDESVETRTGIDHRLHSLQQPASRTRGSKTKNHKRKGTTPRMW